MNAQRDVEPLSTIPEIDEPVDSMPRKQLHSSETPQEGRQAYALRRPFRDVSNERHRRIFQPHDRSARTVLATPASPSSPPPTAPPPPQAPANAPVIEVDSDTDPEMPCLDSEDDDEGDDDHDAEDDDDDYKQGL